MNVESESVSCFVLSHRVVTPLAASQVDTMFEANYLMMSFQTYLFIYIDKNVYICVNLFSQTKSTL